MISARPNVAGVRAKMRAARAELEHGVARGMEASAEEAKAAAQATTAFQDRTGKLRGSISTRAAGWTGNVWRVVVRAGARYANFVEMGTRPHEIRPRRARVLTFVAGGKRIFVRMVHHPGTKPAHFMRDALLAESSRFYDRMRRMLADVVRRINS